MTKTAKTGLFRTAAAYVGRHLSAARHAQPVPCWTEYLRETSGR